MDEAFKSAQESPVETAIRHYDMNGSNGRDIITKSTPDSEIPALLVLLEKELDVLREQVGQHVSKISTVLSPDFDEPTPENPAARYPESELGQSIHQLTAKVQVLQRIMSNANSRLKL